MLGLLLAPSAGVAAPDPRPLSKSALGQIQALLQEKASRTAPQRKLESHLIHALKRSRGEMFAPGAPGVELDATLTADGRVLVDINATVTPELLALVRQGGGEVGNSSPQFRTLRALLAVAQLEVVAASQDVTSIRRAGQARANTGSINSEGDTAHRAISARSTFAASGAGVKIGVLASGVQYLSQSQASGDLGAVTILAGQSGVSTSAEGTAMLEIIHDLAPEAQLYFATAEGGQATFAQNILNLYNAGCRIMVDDVGYFDESPFQDGMIAQAVNTVTAGGTLYFEAAGNAGNLDSGNSGTWEGDFVDGGSAGGASRLHSFGPDTANTVLTSDDSAHVDLFWSDPLGGAFNDYDLFVLDSTGTTIVRSSTTTQNGAVDPYESVPTLNEGESIVIVQFSGAGRFLHLSTSHARLAIPTAGAIAGHSATTNAFSVVAVDAATAYPSPFSGGSANPVETFSSDGPRHVFFHANGAPMTPGNFSSTGGAIRQKPDLAAADGVSTSVPGFEPFYGTSAAAPHAAAIAALLKSYNPNLTANQLRAVLTGSALDIMAPGIDRDSGAGIVMADAALQAAPPGALLITPGAGFAASGPTGGPFTTDKQDLFLANDGVAPFNWKLVNTAAWLDVSAASGALTPGGTAARVTVRLNSASSNLTAGVYVGTIWITNLASGLGQSRQVSLAVSAPLEPSATYAAALTALHPLAYWRLNETTPPPAIGMVSNSGSLGPAATGFDFGGVRQAQPGVVGSCFRFSNTNLIVDLLGSHVDVAYEPALNPNGPFTVEFWARPAQLTTDSFSPACSLDISQNGMSSRFGWVFYQTVTNTWQLRVGGFSGYVATVSGGVVQPNAWHHVVGVYDGANISLYVNGHLADGPTVASGFAPNAVAPLRLGATTIPNRTFDGWVDEAAIYAGALSAGQIAAHYAAATTNNSGYAAQIAASHPLGYWGLEEPPYTAPDRSALPVAINLGSLAPIGNGIYQQGAVPGTSGAPAAAFGTSNYACQFGFPAYVDIPGAYLNLTGPLVLSSWIKASPVADSVRTVISKGNSSYRLFLDGSGYPHFARGTNSANGLFVTKRIDDGQWHELAGVYDGVNSEFLYVDGKLAAVTFSATALITGNANDLWIGANPDTGANFFTGAIDEAAIFTNALTAAQVRQLHDATVAPVFQSVGVDGGAVLLRWSAVPGRTYQLQFKTNVAQTAWRNLSSIVATNATATASDISLSTPGKLYRAVLLP